MRPFLTLLLCGAIAAPGAAPAQELSAPARSETPPVPALAPLPELAPVVEEARPQVAPPTPRAEGVAAPTLEPPTDSAPVLMEQKPGMGGKVGKVAAGMAGGAAGAVVLGPVGKFAGAFVGKRVAGKLFGNDGIPKVTEPVPAEVAQAGRPASAAAPAPKTP